MLLQDILKDQWSPALTIKTALLSLQALLSSPEPSDPQDAEVAKMYTDDYETWKQTARFWTESFAMPRDTGMEGAIARLGEMGFPADKCAAALEANGGDESAALDALLADC